MRECDEYMDADIDEDAGAYGFCNECQCNVHAVRRNFGIGRFEYWGSRGVHRDWRDACPECGSDDIGAARDG